MNLFLLGTRIAKRWDFTCSSKELRVFFVVKGVLVIVSADECRVFAAFVPGGGHVPRRDYTAKRPGSLARVYQTRPETRASFYREVSQARFESQARSLCNASSVSGAVIPRRIQSLELFCTAPRPCRGLVCTASMQCVFVSGFKVQIKPKTLNPKSYN